MPSGTELDLRAHWDLIARGIYRRDNCLALYNEVERLHKVVQELNAALAKAAEAKTGD
jgi:hypothetical protein